MKAALFHVTTDVIQNPTTAKTIASATGVTGAATWFSWIPLEIGGIASIIGVVVTILLFTMQIRKYLLEVALLKKELAK